MARTLATLAILIGSCGPPAGADGGAGCGTGPGTVEVGAGGSRLRALSERGGELSIIRGAQGGIHVVVGAWVADMDLELELRYRLTDAGTPVGDETVRDLAPGLFAPDGDRWVRHPDLVVLDDDEPRVDDFAGRRLTLEVEARSVDGSHACDRREVTLVDPDA
ncbi:MAG TPA: hypothetical protein RMH99_31670 [Sandaracinaceae bacterium LLY-WYZ-13_1]|nr:hypothetical protein [Sandaracinaceae bacterium LLY-WYZ-13_1]